MLKTSDLQSLKKHYEVKNFKKGDVIFPQGQVANGAFIVIKGIVHLKKRHKQENFIQHIGDIGPGDSFGAWYILFESELRAVSAEAYEDCELIFIPNLILAKKLKNCDPFIIYCFRKWIDLFAKNKVPGKKVSKESSKIKNDPSF
ncbi:MAG: hypothetical protein CL572_06225 [Alphaproteobacteria bacterium]|nr:hypothetical protein [Alphaproteobacteria bacterium]|tara:strand:- start:98 stop:532 length:435 start_codon:yes stop_codon:yes gene_type:complete